MAIIEKGTCRAGAARRDLTPSDAHPMAGYSFAGQVGIPGDDRLFARCFYMEDAESGDPVAWVFLDLHSVSLALHRATCRELQSRGRADLVQRVVLTGTHTHTAPGKYFGNRFYDTFLHPQPLSGFDAALTVAWAVLIVDAILEAEANAQEATLSVVSDEVFGVARNRSFGAWQKNGLPLPAPSRGGAGLQDEQRAINPRLTVLVAVTEGKHLASAAFYGCHATSLGQAHPHFDRDWPGVAVDEVERRWGGQCAFGGGTSGDISPYVLRDGLPLPQSIELRNAVGTVLGQRIAACIEEVLSSEQAPGAEEAAAVLPITLHSGLFEVPHGEGGPRIQFGVPMLGGSEDGGAPWARTRLATDLLGEGFVSKSGPHAPQAPAFGPLQEPVRTLLGLNISPYHPWHRVRLGEFLICTMPGEPTGPAGAYVAHEVTRAVGAQQGIVIGYSGDYAGYFTTPAEYRAQHYEGASTLYGIASIARFATQAAGPERAIPCELGDDALPPVRTDVPARQIELLLTEAIEHPEGSSDRRAVFAVEAPTFPPPCPQVQVVGDSGQPVDCVVRPQPHPDRVGAPNLATFIAIWPEEVGAARQLLLRGGGERQVVDAAAAKRRFSAASGSSVLPKVRPLSLWFLLSTLPALLFFGVGLLAPNFLLGELNLMPFGMRAFVMQMVALTPGLLGVEAVFARRTDDMRAAAAHAGSALLFWIGVLTVSLILGANLAPLLCAAAGIVTTGVAWTASLANQRRRLATSEETWEFWWPFFSIAALTLVGGGAFILLAEHWVCWLSDSPDPQAAHLVRLFGLGFVVNTVAMGRSSTCRDLAVVNGQIRGSQLFDSIAPVLIVLAVAQNDVKVWALVLCLPFVWFVSTFSRLRRRAQSLTKTEVLRPVADKELCRLVDEARGQQLLLRVMGSGHSVPAAVQADVPPGPPPRRASSAQGMHLSLELMDQIVAVDRTTRTITVQAGMHLGESPEFPRSVQNNLARHLFHLGWALPDLGGIIHQTVAGFLATGSSGGTLQHCLTDAVLELRFVDGQGRLQCVSRAKNPDDFAAVLVSMGLLGCISEVTFRCEGAYLVQGREFATPVTEDKRVVLPASRELPERVIALTEEGSLAQYLSETEYCRIIWWPQEGVQTMIFWEGRRAVDACDELKAYEPPAPPVQWLGGKVLKILGYSYGTGLVRFVGRRLERFKPWAIRQFIPKEEVQFCHRWDVNLPMDTHVDDYLLPTEFTELWLPLESCHQVMALLLELYEDPEVAGTFSCEVYAARRSDAWLSPAFGRDCFRVDIFWFKGNQGDPVVDYFPQFWQRLAAIPYRCHWGKYLPPAGSPEGASRIEREYPRLGDWRERRAAFDPDGVFLSRYFRQHLRLEIPKAQSTREGRPRD